jgi:hypothetical protein
MISIRTEAYAPLRIDNVDITVIKQLEISIFPCTNYVLRLQITKSLADLLHKYFSIGRLEAYEDAYSSSTIHEVSPGSSSLISKSAVSTPSSPTKLSASNLTTTSAIVSSSSAGELLTSSLALDNKSEGGTSSGGSGAIMTKRSSIFSVFSSNKESPSSTSTSSLKKTLGGKSKKKKKDSSESDSSDHAGSTPRGNRAISMLSGTSDNQSEQLVKSSSRKSQPFLSGNKGTSGGSGGGGGGGGAVDISQKPVLAKKRQEGLYIVYLRVGDINVDVSTSGFGFALNLDRFQAIMDKYFCKKQVLNWKRLIWEVEKHLVTSLIKNTASSSFTKLFSSLTHRGSMIGKQPLALTTSGGGSSTASHFLNPTGLTSSSSSTSGHHGTTGSAASAPSIDPEVLLTSKKNLLLGGRMVKAKPRTSSIAVLAKRPTLYASPSSFPSGASSSKNSQDDDLGDVHDIQPFPSSSAVSSSSERDEERRPPAVVHPSTFNFLNPRGSTSNSNSGTPTGKEGTGKEGKKRISTLPSLFHSPFSSISSPSAGHSHEQKLQTGANVNTSEPASASGSQGQTPASGGSSSSNKKFLGLF